MSHKTKIAIFLTIFLWASAFVGIRVALQGYSPEGLALLRYLIASFCMGIVYFRLPKRSTMELRDIVKLLVIGIVGIGIYNVALNRGEIVVSSGMSSFLISQSPILTTFLAIMFLGESLNLPRALGFMVSICGIVLITLGESGGFKWDAGISLILIALLAGSFYSILQKPFLKKYHIMEPTTYVIWGGTLFLLLYTPQLHHDLLHASLKATLTVVYLGVFPATIGYIGWSYALAEIPASRAVSYFYYMPFISTLLGWLCLGEVPALMSIIGGVVAIVGVWLVNQSYVQPKVQIVSAEA